MVLFSDNSNYSRCYDGICASAQYLGLALSTLLSVSAFAQSAKTDLLLYCGITMVRPMTEIAQNFEKRENVKITIAQGGSEDLFQSAKKSAVGD